MGKEICLNQKSNQQVAGSIPVVSFIKTFMKGGIFYDNKRTYNNY